MAQKEEHSHRESEEKFAKAFRCSPQPFTLSTLKEDRYIEVNDAFELKTGYRREEVIGGTLLILHILTVDNTFLNCVSAVRIHPAPP